MDEKVVMQMAIEAITQEIEAGSASATLYKERGRLRMLTGDKTGAMQDLRQAIVMDPNIVGDLQDGSFCGNIGACH